MKQKHNAISPSFAWSKLNERTPHNTAVAKVLQIECYLEQKCKMPTEMVCRLGRHAVRVFMISYINVSPISLIFYAEKFKFIVRADIGGCVSITINLFRLCGSKPKVDMQNPGDALLDLSQ